MITLWHILVYVIHTCNWSSSGGNLNLVHANNKGTSPVLNILENIIAIIYECGILIFVCFKLV